MDTKKSHGPLLRLHSVIDQTGLSRTTIYRLVKDGTFPAPLKLGARAIAWTKESVQDWMESLVKKGGV